MLQPSCMQDLPQKSDSGAVALQLHLADRQRTLGMHLTLACDLDLANSTDVRFLLRW